MRKKIKKSGLVVRYNRLHDGVAELTPSLYAFLNDVEEFSELRVKARDDGSVLAIAKGYDSSGGPIVSFGVGYDAIGALLGIDGTIQAGKWKVDKPWDGGTK